MFVSTRVKNILNTDRKGNVLSFLIYCVSCSRTEGSMPDMEFKVTNGPREGKGTEGDIDGDGPACVEMARPGYA